MLKKFSQIKFVNNILKDELRNSMLHNDWQHIHTFLKKDNII